MKPIAVVSVTWNGRTDVLRLLAALARIPYPLAIAVVDNASNDDTAAAIAEQFPTVTVLRQPHNLGGAGGFAVGMQWALDQASELVWLLDSDAWPRDDALAPLLASLERRPEIGAVGSLIAMADRPHVTQELGGSFSPSTGRPHFHHACAPVDTRLPEREVDWVPACSLLARVDVLRQVGVFDPAWFVFGDDLDWCWRVRSAGWRIVAVPASVVFHRYPGGKTLTPWRAYYSTRNMPELFRRHRSGPSGLFLRWLWLGHGLLHARRWARWGQAAEAAAAYQAVTDAAARRLGRRDDLPAAVMPFTEAAPELGSDEVLLAGGGELWADLAAVQLWRSTFPSRRLTILATPALAALLADEPDLDLLDIASAGKNLRRATVLISGRPPLWLGTVAALWRCRAGRWRQLTPWHERVLDALDHLAAGQGALLRLMRGH